MNAADCRTHAAAMVDLIHGGPAAGVDTELLDALRTCERCRPEVEAILLGSWAVERAWQVARDVEPPETAWPKVRDLARRPRGDTWRGSRPRARDRHGCRADCAALVGPAGGDHRIRTRERTRRVAVGSARGPLLRAGGHIPGAGTDRDGCRGHGTVARRTTIAGAPPGS